MSFDRVDVKSEALVAGMKAAFNHFKQVKTYVDTETNLTSDIVDHLIMRYV